MTFAQRFHDERAQCLRAGSPEPTHCYLGAFEWAEFERFIYQSAQGGTFVLHEELKGTNPIYCNVEMHHLTEPSHFRFS